MFTFKNSRKVYWHGKQQSAMYCNPLIFLTEIGEAASKRCHLRETGRIGRRPPGVGGQLVTWGPNHGGSSLIHVHLYSPQPILDCALLPMTMTKALIHWQCCNLLEKPAGQQSQSWLWRMSTQNSWMTFTLCIQLVLSTVCIQCTLHYFSLIFLWPLYHAKRYFIGREVEFEEEVPEEGNCFWAPTNRI